MVAHAFLFMKLAAEREAYVGGGERRRRHLIEERWKAMEVIAVNYPYSVFILVDMLAEVKSGETASDDDDIFHRRKCNSRRLSSGNP